MKAHDFDKAFDNGEDVLDALDYDQATRPNREMRRVNVDFPAWMLAELDREAARLGINRQAVIKTWIARVLESRRTP
jgi:hypothetical protein